MSFRPPQTNVDAFADPDQQAVVREIRDRVQTIEQAVGVGSFSSQGKTAPLPPRASMQVTTDHTNAPGHFFVEITNPEYAPGTANSLRTPIIHQLQASPVANFSSGVYTWPPGVQTTYTITQFGVSTMYFRVKSSYDGKNFTQPLTQGPFQS